jgi:hypothetical protein
MNCEKVNTLLTDYLDGKLDRALSVSLESHLQGCASCEREMHALSILWKELPKLQAQEPPAFLHERIMSRVEAHAWNEQRQPRLSFRNLIMSWQFAAGVATTLLLGMLTIAFANPKGVQGFFGFSFEGDSSTQELRPMPHPVMQTGAKVEWRSANGNSLPVFVIGTDRLEKATLAWSSNALDTGEAAQVLWQGELKPGTTLEMPLSWASRMPMPKANAFMLWWNTPSKARVFFIPVNYPAMKIAGIRLQQPLSGALQHISAQYQMVIEWQPSNRNNPFVVLDVSDATAEETLNKLLEGTPYVARLEGECWVVRAP